MGPQLIAAAESGMTTLLGSDPFIPTDQSDIARWLVTRSNVSVTASVIAGLSEGRLCRAPPAAR
jgi:hypothetical protein